MIGRGKPQRSRKWINKRHQARLDHVCVETLRSVITQRTLNMKEKRKKKKEKTPLERRHLWHPKVPQSTVTRYFSDPPTPRHHGTHGCLCFDYQSEGCKTEGFGTALNSDSNSDAYDKACAGIGKTDGNANPSPTSFIGCR